MRILFAWEMGHNFGHATQIAALARALKKRKADIWMALKSPAAGMKFLDDFPGRILQAPYHPIVPGRATQPLTYAEGLFPCGYDSAENLTPLIASWRALFDLVKPDILITESAPTALLAARGLKIRRMAFGRGFDMPPLATPMPPLRYWEKNDTVQMRAREGKILEVINDSLQALRIKSIKHFRDILQTDRDYLCTFRELDHYPHRPETTYYGSLFTTDSGKKIDWKLRAAKRIFVYISPKNAVFGVCIEALRRLPANYDVIVAASGMPEKTREKLEMKHLRIIDGPVRLDRLLKKCDLAITNAGSGLAAGLALAGVPALMLPLHIEQLMSARAVGRTGLGLALIGHVTADHISEKIKLLLSEAKYTKAAQAMAARYKKFSPKTLADKIAAEIIKG